MVDMRAVLKCFREDGLVFNNEKSMFANGGGGLTGHYVTTTGPLKAKGGQGQYQAGFAS
jgi:hypothetical protein